MNSELEKAYTRWQDYEAEVGSKEFSANGQGLTAMYRKAERLRREYESLVEKS